ncbi:MAG TPA: hypothetical protein PK748_01990 [Acidimicrobiales bacterium]|jgi:alkylated DNA repair dioxygenase AlkB|nr:hypothetical protein [Acidimicrobiales bacterium]HMS87990.1 hypothetical protein [Acidimicrobiales bacterium]HRA33665.1 hypothetical protein [Acidimicrobiales bacterium]
MGEPDDGDGAYVDRSVPFERTQLDDTSWVDVARGWMAGADELGARLLADVSWQTSRLFRYDHLVEEKRLGSFWSRTSGRPVPHPALAEATRVLQHHYGVTFDGFGMIQYRDGSDGQGFHRDTDMRWLDDTLIAVLTLGAQRPWLLRPVQRRRGDDGWTDGWTDGRDEEATPDIDLAPASGDLLVLGGRAQADWLHSVAYQPGRRLEPRVSIQWRWVRRTGRPHVGAGYSAPRTFGQRANRAR